MSRARVLVQPIFSVAFVLPLSQLPVKTLYNSRNPLFYKLLDLSTRQNSFIDPIYCQSTWWFNELKSDRLNVRMTGLEIRRDAQYASSTIY